MYLKEKFYKNVKILTEMILKFNNVENFKAENSMAYND